MGLETRMKRYRDEARDDGYVVLPCMCWPKIKMAKDDGLNSRPPRSKDKA